MAQHAVKSKTKLGPGFWPVTVLIVIVSAIMVALVYASQWPIGLIPAGEPAGSVDELFKFLGAVAACIFNVVVIYTIYFAIVFRRPANAPPNVIGVQIHDAPVLEFWWTAIPTILVIVLAIFSTKIWNDLQSQQGDVLTIEAVGYQFGWNARYPKLPQPVAEIHVPVDTPVTIHVTSRDVIHSFWVPELRIKADMVPGLINTLRITGKVPGKYRLVCTEFCGIAHGAMRANFFIDSQTDFKKWFAGQAKEQGVNVAGGAASGAGAAGGGGSAQGTAVALATGKADAGQTAFNAKCTACHGVGGYDEKKVGPGLGHLFNDKAHPKLVDDQPATPENVAAILKNGYAPKDGGVAMPNASMNGLSAQDIANLTAYLVSLSK